MVYAMPTNKPIAAKTRLQPGEHSIERVVDSLPAKGPYEASISLRDWEGKLRRSTVKARTKGEFRRKGLTWVERKLGAATTTWSKGKQITAFIEKVSQPLIESAPIRPNTRARYLLALAQVRKQLEGLTIGNAVAFRTLERAIQTIGTSHGKESARQARTVTSKYIIDQLPREGLIEHNPLRGVSIDYGSVNKGTKTAGGVAITDKQYDAIIEHLLNRDTSVPLPPGTDRRQTSINKHDLTVALTLLQAATGLRISEALALTTAAVTDREGVFSVTVTAEQSKTHRGRTVPLLDQRVAVYWRDRLKSVETSAPLIPSPGNPLSPWRTDNAVKATAALYKDLGVRLSDDAVGLMRSHAWRTILNNRALARGVSAEVRAAYFGHTEDVNSRAYTDLTDVSSMFRALNPDT